MCDARPCRGFALSDGVAPDLPRLPQMSSTPTKSSMPFTAYDLLKHMETPSPRGAAASPVVDVPARSLQGTHRPLQSVSASSSPQTPEPELVVNAPYLRDEISSRIEGREEGASESAAQESMTSVADGMMQLLESPELPGESALPPVWDDLLQMLASLPLPSRTGMMDVAKPDSPPQTTIGLMVKPDSDNDGLGLVTGWVEGSTSDLSREIMVGDILLAVDETPFNHPDSLKKMRGGHMIVSAGTEMRLTLEREGTGVFDVVLVREPYVNLQLKREVFELLSRLSAAVPGPLVPEDPEDTAFLLACLRAKLIDLEKANVHSLRLVRSELQGLQQVLEQIVVSVNRAAGQGGSAIRSLIDRMVKQDDEIARMSSELLATEVQTSEQQLLDHQSHDQVHLLRHECNRLRNSLQMSELELEGLRESFDRKLDEQGLRDPAEDICTREITPIQALVIQGLDVERGSDSIGAEAPAAENLQALLDEERDNHNLAQAALKRDLWVSVIRRWLNNCCRKIIACWRSELARKQHHRVVCSKLGRRCRRRHMLRTISSFFHEMCESRRLRHAGVSAASGWMFLGIRKHLQAWLAYVDWKAYSQRLEAKCRAKSVALIFHAWSRIVTHSTPGLDCQDVKAILSPICGANSTGTKETRKNAENISPNTALESAKHKSSACDKSVQTLRWESDASIQCSFDGRATSAVHSACGTSSASQTTSISCVSTACQCDGVENVGNVKQLSTESKKDSFLFRSMQENFEKERKECQRLRESLSTAQESMRRQDDLLKGAQDSDRRLKESLQMAHARLQRSLKGANEDRHRATLLGQELEQAERKLLLSHEERDELRIIVSDERRINARGNATAQPAVSHPLAAQSSRRYTPSKSRHGMITHEKIVAHAHISVRKMRLLCLNMALSKQWRRLAVIFVSWAAYVRQYCTRREGVMRMTSRRFYASMREFLGVWFAMSKCVCRTRVLLVGTCLQ